MLKWRWVARVLTPQRYEVVRHKFARYGNRVLFAARFLPGMRTTIYATAGATRQVSLLRFLLIDGIAALISVPVWVYLGYFGADNHVWLMKWMQRGQNSMWFLLCLALLCMVWLWWRHRRQRIGSDD
jgi:membrane protein DedA with SNARE-associated domain